MPQDDDTSLPLPPFRPSDGRPLVYVINSNEEFLELIGDLLSDSRAEVVLEQMRPNLEITLDNLRSAHPDLVILDIISHQQDGPILLGRIAEDEKLRNLPVMLASTNPRVAEQLANTYANIVRDILPKPFDLEDFFAKLNHLVVGINAR